MGQWLRSINSKSRRKSRNPAYAKNRSAAKVVAALPVVEEPRPERHQ
jgi:hypothetical protein